MKQAAAVAASNRGVLFLCTGNSARSIIAQCLLERLGEGRFQAYSAGSRPTGSVNPYALELLREHDYDTTLLRSKSWDEFAQPHGPALYLVITVCGNAAEEICPVWPGTPLSAHWGMPDPAAVRGSPQAKRAAFAAAYELLQSRIQSFLALPLPNMDAASLQRALDAIGHQRR